MTILEKIDGEIIVAMKAGEKSKLETLRLLKSALKNERIEKGADLTDEDVVGVIRRMVKQNKEALVDFTNAGRAELIKKSEEEIKLLDGYLPSQLSDEEIKKVVEKKIVEMGKDNMGKVMGAVMSELKGKADGAKVRFVVESVLKS